MPQTSWWLQLQQLLLLGFAVSADSDVIYKVIDRLSQDKVGCELPDNVHMDTHCHPVNLDEIRHLPARTVPPGVECVFDEKKDFIYTCSDKGIWIEDKPTDVTSKTGPHHRDKRWILAIIAAGGPNFLQNLGLMKKLLCLYLCKKPNATAGTTGTARRTPVRRRIPALMPPRITCPKVPSPQHPLAGKSVKVTWKEPFASDRFDGPIDAQQIKGKPPGSRFEEGKHFIHYKAKNSKGLAAYCTISFVVEISRCSRPKWPWNGKMKCDNEQVSGSVCTFTCNIGFYLEGDSQMMCLRQKWVGTNPTCKPVICPPPPKVANADLDCPNNNYAYTATCSVNCHKGFQSAGLSMILCNSTGTWTAAGTCTDTKAPSFPSGCVEDQRALAGPRDAPAEVTWERPNVTDNSGNDITITYSHNPGSRFPLGRTTVTVKAQDKSRNTIKCSFSVYVEAETCTDPTNSNKLNGDLLVYDCPNGTSLGYSCNVSCKAGYPLDGASTITCSKDSKSGKLRWTWETGKTKPFCKSTECPKLREPINGAISCDKWGHGIFCSMLCNSKYDVPRRAPNPYVCGASDGKWRPHSTVQDCIVRRLPNKMRLPAEMYYKSGSCPQESAKKEISKNFITMLRSSPLFKEECGERVPDCKPEMVNVRCGEVRDKRDVTSAKGNTNTRHSTKSVVIEFQISIPYNELGGNGSTSAKLYTKLFSDISKSVDSLVKNKKLGMEKFNLKNPSFAPGVPTIDCPKGTSPRFETGSCPGCPTGTFYNETTDDCEGCAKGFYQDEAFSDSCKSCPEGQTTASNGSRTIENCTDMCPVGHHSKYGIVPCIPCPTGTYQDHRGKSVCNTCPPGLTTLDMAVNTSASCTAYDMKTGPSDNVTLGEITATKKPISIYSWLFIGEVETEATLYEFETDEKTKLAVMWKNNKVTVVIGSDTFQIKEELSASKWHHVTLTVDTGSLIIALYVNGESVFTKTTSNFPRILSNVLLKCVSTNSVLMYSGLNVIDRILGNSDLAAISSTCNRSVSDSIFRPNMTAGKMISPSRCDAFDDCESRPCGDHECVDEGEGYACLCSDGFTGHNCDIPPDRCLHNMCQNEAKCVANAVNYTCQCAPGFKGDLCEIKIVNGKWGPWEEWSFCSRVCGGGTRKRNRKCDNPPPDPEGRSCEGDSTEVGQCNKDECRVCPPLKRSYGVVTSCQTTDDLTQCTIKCRDDLVFAEEPLPMYECGAKTDYHWSHQTDTDPDGRLPACTPVRAARSFTMKRSINLPTLPCTPEGKLDKSVTSQVEGQSSDLACVKNNMCKPKVDVRKCQRGRHRRGAGTTVSMTISTTVGKDADLELGKLINNHTMTIAMRNYLKTMLMFEQSAQEVVNTSAKVFAVSINGVRYEPDVKSATADVVVECPPGEVESAGACSKCPAGAREEEGSCVLCGKGYYQPQTGATSCTRCTQGKTTIGTGARSQSECSVTEDHADANTDSVSTQESPVVDEKSGSDHTLIIVLSVMITAMVVSITAAAIIWIVKMKKLPNGSLAWGESGRNKINPGGEETSPPPYPAVYVPPPPPPYTPMDSLLPGTTAVRPNTASDVQLRVMAGANSPNINVKGVPAATQTSLGPTPSTTPHSSRNPSPNRKTPSPSHSRTSSRSASPARNLADTVNSRSSSRCNSPARTCPALEHTSLPAATIETRNVTKGSVKGAQSRSRSPKRHLRCQSRSPSPARSLANSVGVLKNNNITPPPPAASYNAPDIPILSPVRKINTADPFPRSKSPSFISSS